MKPAMAGQLNRSRYSLSDSFKRLACRRPASPRRSNGRDRPSRPPRALTGFIVLLTLALSACEENIQKGEKGDQGPAGPEGAPGPVGAAGMSGTVIRFVEIECRQICFVACKENERILSAYAINPGGTFTFDPDNRRAAFRPQLQGALVKVVLACVEK
jgi:hypothetical protein